MHPASSAGRVSELVALADELASTVKIKRSAVTQTVIGSPGTYDDRRDALFMARGLPGWQRPQVLVELRRESRLRLEVVFGVVWFTREVIMCL